MIYYVTTERHNYTITRFLKANPDMKNVMTSLSYEELFFLRAGPVGHYIFTDHDRLTRYELDCVSRFCARLRKVAPNARQLNHPAQVKDRFALLDALRKAGINSFDVTRIENGQRPPHYPAFIRSEDGAFGPETDLIENDAQYDQALETLAASGQTRRGRMAIGYAAEADKDGFYRKYGAYRIGGDILPHHIHIGRHWIVKRTVPDLEWTVANDRSDGLNDKAVAEELEFVRNNPHKDILLQAYEIAGLDFGRIDYSIVNGRVEIYEINTNPLVPQFLRSDARDAIREITKPPIINGFRDINTPLKCKLRYVHFTLPSQKAHSFRLPIQNLSKARWQLFRWRMARWRRACFRFLTKGRSNV